VDAGPADIIILGPDRPDAFPNLPDAPPDLPDASINLPDATPTAPDGTVAVPAQSWTGYIANHKFPSGSDVIKIAFVVEPSGQLVGTVTLGSGAPPAPPTDPNVGYPPGYTVRAPPGTLPTILYEGFAYPMLRATQTGSRLQFGIGFWELWKDWCAIQTPAPGSTLCLSNRYIMTPAPPADWTQCSYRVSDTGEDMPVDCGKVQLCVLSPACTCDAVACAVVDRGVQISFDLAITGDRADGSTAGSLGDRLVHLTRVQ
jgi:hypothetical protein